MNRTLSVIALACALAACNSSGGEHGSGGNLTNESKPGDAFSAIGEADVLHFSGTEPFWGGKVSGKVLTYTTPENPDGTTLPVQRFAGNNGLAFNGAMGDQPFDMAVTHAPCGDGMSDRTYPFTVTLRISGEVRQGCGWTDAKPFEGPKAP
jgi:uncharacterized membrane protein